MGLYSNLAWRMARSQAPESLRKNMLPMKITVASTFLCNHRCTMCDIWQVYRKDAPKLKEELSREDFQVIFKEMSRDLLYLDWGGGEPFLRPDMVEILSDAVAACPKLASVVITTNGLMPDRIMEYISKLAVDFPGVLWALGVSVDGDEELHDFIRGKKGAFAHAIDSLKRLRTFGIDHPNVEAKISYTISYRNAGTLEAFDREVLRPIGMNVGDVGFGLEHVGGLFQTEADPDKSAVGKVSEEQFRVGARHDVEYAIEHLRNDKLPMLQKLKSVYRKFFLEEIPGYLEQPKKMVIPCTASRSSIYLDPYGYIYPCIVWSRQLGHFRDGIANVLASPKTQETRGEIAEGKCPVCWNACEAIPSLLSSLKMVSCVARSFTDANMVRSMMGSRARH